MPAGRVTPLFHPTTPGLPVLEVSHGVGAVIVKGIGAGTATVLNPDIAEKLAAELCHQAELARRAVHRVVGRIPPLEG